MTDEVQQTPETLARDVKELLRQIIEVMDTANELGFAINFGLNTDSATKKTTVSHLSVAKSYL